MRQSKIEADVCARRSVKKLFQILLSKQGTLRVHLVRETAGTFALKISYLGLGFLSTLLLIRLLGAAGYGIYSYVLSIAALLLIPSTLGLVQLIIRSIASYQAQSSWALIRGLLQWANRTVFAASIGVVLLAAIITWLFSEHFSSQVMTTFLIALLMVPLVALSQIRQATLQGLSRITEGQLLESLIQPVFFIFLISTAYAFFQQDISVRLIMGMQGIAVGLAFIVGSMMVKRRLPAFIKEFAPLYETRSWMRSALPLLSIGVMSALNQNIEIIILGSIRGPQEVGLYRVAIQLTSFIPFMLYIVNTVMGPTISHLHTTGDRKRLQRMITLSARFALLFSLPLVMAFIIFGKWFLLLFGPEFSRAVVALGILGVGQLINVASGSVGLILIMTGHEYDSAKGITIAALTDVVLSALLIPIWGMNGAAIANAVSMTTWNILLVIWVYNKLGIHPTALG